MKKPLRIITIIIIVALLGATGYLGFRFQQLRTEKAQLSGQLNKANQDLKTYRADPTQASKAEVSRIVEEVGKLYALPKGEDPSVATVKDKQKLKDQPFFNNAENDDVTLIYSKAKLAVLYRPSSQKIINVSSVTIEDKPTAPPAANP